MSRATCLPRKPCQLTATRTSKEPRTAERILDVAERLVQLRGFNGFSYADIASELGITKASLHYHFPSKAELGRALIVRYAERFADALSHIDRELPDACAKLDAYAGLYADVLRGKRMCLCGILAAEYETLPKPMRAAVIAFFDDNQLWLESVLAQGAGDDQLTFAGSRQEVAQGIIGTLEGAMLVARPYDDVARFDSTARQLLAGLST